MKMPTASHYQRRPFQHYTWDDLRYARHYQPMYTVLYQQSIPMLEKVLLRYGYTIGACSADDVHTAIQRTWLKVFEWDEQFIGALAGRGLQMPQCIVTLSKSIYKTLPKAEAFDKNLYTYQERMKAIRRQQKENRQGATEDRSYTAFHYISIDNQQLSAQYSEALSVHYTQGQFWSEEIVSQLCDDAEKRLRERFPGQGYIVFRMLCYHHSPHEIATKLGVDIRQVQRTIKQYQLFRYLKNK